MCGGNADLYLEVVAGGGDAGATLVGSAGVEVVTVGRSVGRQTLYSVPLAVCIHCNILINFKVSWDTEATPSIILIQLVP